MLGVRFGEKKETIRAMFKTTWIHPIDALPVELLRGACANDCHGLDQLGPDGLPVVGAQLFSRDLAASSLLNQDAGRQGHGAVSANPLIDEAGGNPQQLRKG